MSGKGPAAAGILVFLALAGVAAYLVLTSGGDPENGSDLPVPMAPEGQQPRSGAGAGTGGGAGISPQPYEGDAGPAPAAGVSQQPTGVSASGYVQGPRGGRVSGARVELVAEIPHRSGRRMADEPAATVVTRSRGRFRFKDLAQDRRYTLRVTHPDYASHLRPGLDPGHPKTLSGIVVKLERGLALSGHVRDQQGQPLPGAVVSVYDQDAGQAVRGGEPEASGKVDRHGRYVIPGLTPGRKRVMARLAGHASAGIPMLLLRSPGDGEGIDFTLKPGFVIEGRVEDAETGTGLAGALVIARPMRSLEEERQAPRPPKVDPDQEDPRRKDGDGPSARETGPPGPGAATSPRGGTQDLPQESTRTDESGAFVLDHLGNAVYALTAEAGGFRRGSPVTSEPGRSGVILTLERLPTVGGHVLGPGGEPVTRFSVALLPQPNAAHVPVGTWIPVEDEDGAFSVAAERTGRFWLRVTAPGYATTETGPVEVPAKGRAEAGVIRLSEGVTLAGRLTDAEGKPVPGGWVTAMKSAGGNRPEGGRLRLLLGARGPRTQSGPDGTWALEHLTPGTYRLQVTHPDYVDLEVGPVRVGGSGKQEVDDITLRGGGTLKGVVTTEEGRPDTQAEVWISSTGTRKPFTMRVTTDHRGRFRVSGMPSGTYRVLVMKRQGRRTADIASILTNPDDPRYLHEVGAGEVVELEL